MPRLEPQQALVWSRLDQDAAGFTAFAVLTLTAAANANQGDRQFRIS